ncbi:MAG: four helix bundle protein [Prevotella sp.]|jgi:four helix bundle protein|nr:four helix bundle protein [Prevotella sp.]
MSQFSFTNIVAWQKAHAFVLEVYKCCAKFPEHEKYGLYSQFTRASVSIPANIAEGYKRLSQSEKLRFMNYAQGSLEECRYYIILSKDLEYIDCDEYSKLNNLIEEVSKLLNGYVKGILSFSAENKTP